MRIAVTGGTGFIGRALVARVLSRGDSVTAFTRSAAGAERAESSTSAASAERAESSTSVATNGGRARARDGALRWVEWDPESEGAWQRELSCDALVHLAGSTAAGVRYSEKVRREILESRVVPTRRLVEGLARLGEAERPRVLVCASGVGFYGPRGDEEVDEWAEAGSDFLAEVCVAWEGAARAAEALGVRVVSARIGFVLGRGGGALAKLLPIFKSFVGGQLGDGKQWVPWIHLDDVVGALLHAVAEGSMTGPMNVVGPNAVTNAEFSRTLGKALRRPALLPAPSFALRALFGAGAVPLLTGQRAVPRALLAHRYPFQFVELEAALKDLVGS